MSGTEADRNLLSHGVREDGRIIPVRCSPVCLFGGGGGGDDDHDDDDHDDDDKWTEGSIDR